MLLSELAHSLGLSLHGPDMDITGVNTLADAGPSDLSFLANPKYAPQLETTRAGAVIVDSAHVTDRLTSLVSANPYLDFARCVQLFAKPQGDFSGISPLAFVHPQACVDSSADIAPFVFIGRDAVIGPRVRIFSGSYVGEDCHIGADCLVYPNCSLMAGTHLGERVTLHAGVVLGSDGFGFAQAASGAMKIPQIGRTIIEDDVEIGANTTIDRAALGETRIGQGTKIDNQVQLGHNVRIGRNCLLVAQVGIAGSTTLGDGVILAGQVGLGGHLHLGDGCRISAKSGVAQDVPAGQDMGGIPAMPHSSYLRAAAIMPRLPELKRRVGKLEKELDLLKSQLLNSEERDHDHT